MNAANISSRKLGDVDFQDAEHHVVQAFEAHAGRLTQVYVAEHLRTLAKSIASRKAELAGIADLDQWTVRVVFVAHEFEGQPPHPLVIDGVNVEIQLQEFGDFVAVMTGGVDQDAVAQSLAFHLYVPLDERRTPNWVRERFRALVN